MFDLNKLNPKIYFSGAIVIGIFQILDGLLALNGFSFPIAQAFSLLEICWLILSIIFLLAFKKQAITLLVPGVYICYSLYGWFVGSYLISVKIPGESIVLPVWYMLSATIFGFIYCLISYRCYQSLASES